MIILNNEKKIEILILVSIFLFPWIFLVFQGLYIAELGYWLVSYENFFNNPEVSQTVFTSWLTTFIGAIVNYILGSLGVVGFKIANVFVIYLTLYFTYKLLSEFTSKKNLLYFLLIAEIFINISTYTYINYYSLTALFFIISTLFLYRGLIHNKLFYLLIAGLFLGLNIFIRFPNLLGIGLIVTVIYYNYGKGDINFKYTLKQIAGIFLGYIIAILSILLIMTVLDQYHLYTNSLNELFIASKESSTHGISLLMTKFIMGQYTAVKHSIILFGVTLTILIVNKYWIKHKRINIFISFLLISLGTFLMIKLFNIEYKNYYSIYDGITGFIYILLLWISFSQFKKNLNLGLIALISFLIIEMIPLGSATGLFQSIYGMYLAIPVILIHIYTVQKITLLSYEISKESLKNFGKLVGPIFIVFSMTIMNFYYAAGIDKNRWTLNVGVNHPKLKANYMTNIHAKTLTDLSNAMDFYSNNFSYILTYGGISAVSYISELKPYLNNTNPFFMTVHNLKKDLEYEDKRKSLPMVVRSKWISNQKKWPENRKEILNVFEIFLKKNNYVSVWENYRYEILIPPLEENTLNLR